MPEMDFSILQEEFLENEPISANLGMYSYMLYPESEELRTDWLKRFRLGIAAQRSLELGDREHTASPDLLLTLLDPSRAGSVHRKNLQRPKQGIQVGYIVIFLLRLEASGEMATLSKARYLAARALKSLALPASKSSLVTSWRTLSSVAHLWAAKCYFDHLVDHKTESIGRSDLSPIPGMAMTITQLLHKTVPKVPREPLISLDKLWNLPSEWEVTPVDVSIQPLTAEELAYLAEYEYIQS